MTTASEENAFGYGVILCLLFLVFCVIVFAIGSTYGAYIEYDRINKILESKGLGHYVMKEKEMHFVLHVDEKTTEKGD